ncbi:uncharacterized protein LOC121861589 [Homarus americanus]|nr:uncharacterized protein LOC121861589 [Homarus americanus]
MVWTLQRFHHHSHLGTSWLPLEDAWGITTAVLGSLVAVFFLWAVLAGYNIRQLTFIKRASPNHKSVTLVSGRIRHLTLVVAGEWTLIVTSLFQHHFVGQYVFCLTTLTQSILITVVYTYGGGDVTSIQCCCRLTHFCSQPPPQEHKERGMEGDKGKGCMDGLMACRMTRAHTYESIPGEECGHLRDDNSEFRARGGSLWSQTTTTVVLPETGELLHSPLDSAGPSIHHLQEPRTHLPLFARGSNLGITGAMRPGNFFFRGTRLECGAGMTCPQPNILSASSLVYEDMDARMSRRKKNFSFRVHQPVIHEMPLDLRQDSQSITHTHHSHLDDTHTCKYLDMSVSKGKQCSKGTNFKTTKGKNDIEVERSYVNVGDDHPRSIILATSQVHPEPNKTVPPYVNMGITSFYNNGKDQCSSSPHHRYLSMEVRGMKHAIQSHSLRKCNGDSTLQKTGVETTDYTRMVSGDGDDVSEEQMTNMKHSETIATATNAKQLTPVKSEPIDSIVSSESFSNDAEQLQKDDTHSEGSALSAYRITPEGSVELSAEAPSPPGKKEVMSVCDQLNVSTSASAVFLRGDHADNKGSLPSVCATGGGSAGGLVTRETTQLPPDVPAAVTE